MSAKFFIIGTDTEIGKTTVMRLLLQLFKLERYSTVALKPVASGCIITKNGLRNEDALLLKSAATVQLSYEQINPFSLVLPVSPHIAAGEMDVHITVANIVECINRIKPVKTDFMLVEGVGGWYVPLNQTETMADVVKAVGFPIILVVGLKLGCLNHALLTYQAILSEGLNLKGWVANCLDQNMLHIEDNIEYLKQHINVPLLGVIPNFEKFPVRLEQIKKFFNTRFLISDV